MKTPKKITIFSFLFTLLFATVISSYAANYEVDPVHSNISFSIRHMVSTVNGRFNEFSGTIEFNQKQPEMSKVSFSVKTASITTANDRRDTDLKSANFFDVTQYPEAVFESTRVISTGKNRARLEGNLTLHGVTKKVELEIEYLGTVKDPWGNQRAGFSASTVIHRKDFGIIWNKVLDNGSLLLGDDANLTINVEAIQK